MAAHLAPSIVWRLPSKSGGLLPGPTPRDGVSPAGPSREASALLPSSPSLLPPMIPPRCRARRPVSRGLPLLVEAQMNATRTILVVDDDYDLCAGLEAVLHRRGYDTLCADDGLDAKKLIDDQHP